MTVLKLLIWFKITVDIIMDNLIVSTPELLQLDLHELLLWLI